MGRMEVTFGDGVSAVDRSTRAIVMLTAEALRHLEELGYERDRHVRIEVHEAGLPVWLTLRGRQVFQIDFGSGSDGLTIVGRWLVPVRKRSWFVTLMGWLTNA